MFFTASTLISALVLGANAKVWDVQVGGPDGALKFTPEAFSAEIGDTVTFHFHPKNHTVTQSSFADPCGPAAGGADSGFQFVAANSTDAPPTYSVQVKDKKPMWFFCRQANATPNFHCGKGMVMSVNCPLDPTAQNSFENFKKSALAVGDRLAKEAAAASGADTAYGQPSASPSASKSWDGYYAGTSVYTAPYGDATLPPPPATIATVTQTVEAQGKTWTTTYASYPGSPDPTPNAEPKVFQVTVGADKKLKFNPERVDAKVGDIISFTFMGGNHTVTQSSFADPCRRLKDPKTNEVTGWTSDFQFVGTSTDFKTVNITVKDTAPAWYYCAQKATASHCGAGMTFAVNSDEKGPRNNAAFQALAQKLNGTAGADTAPSASGSAAGAGPTGAASSTVASMSVVLGAVAFGFAALL